jgi:hypothetical protein
LFFGRHQLVPAAYRLLCLSEEKTVCPALSCEMMMMMMMILLMIMTTTFIPTVTKFN